jgi:hypothetical protein
MIKAVQNIIFCTSLLAFWGCVNNIENTSVPVTNQLDKTPLLFNYTGIVRVDSIAHDKVEIVFEKVKDDDKDYVYKLYINDADPGLELNPNSLLNYGNGRYYFIQSGLHIKTYYKFKIRAFNKIDGGQSALERVQTIQTFDNRVADFNGILNITPVAGTEGAEQPSLRIQWDKVPYFNWGNQTAFDPVRYEVYYTSAGPEDLWEPSPTRRGPVIVNVLTEFVHPSETVITDYLAPDTQYYFWVRAVHRAYSNFEVGEGGYIPVARENNKKFLSFRTAARGGLPGYIEARNSFNLYPGLQSDGLTKVRASWLPSKGNYLKYKLVYFNQAPAASEDFSNEQISTILSSIDPEQAGVIDITKESQEFKNSKIDISNLRTGQTYHFKLFLCTDATCPLTGANVSQSYDLKSITVAPMLASFLGINSIDNPNDPTKLDEIKLNFDSPVLSIGWANKMEFFCEDGANSYLLTESANNSAPSTSPCYGLRHLPFVNDSISISGLKNLMVKGVIIDKNNPKQYCFSATPLLEYTGLSGSVQVRRDSRIQRCIVPELITPNIQEFAGLNSCSPVTSLTEKKLKLTYPAPRAGIYQKYVVFWKPKTLNPFSFNTALTNYETKMTIDGLDRETCTGEQYCFKTLNNTDDYYTPALGSGDYETGVMTYAKVSVNSVDTYYWSQINTSVKDCKISPPFATFKGWLRIFAIGPKTSHTDKGSGGQFKIREAINEDGIPYELSLLTSQTAAPALFKPPGQALLTTTGSVQTINLGTGLDIAKDIAGGYGSEEGIISLAWEDINLDNNADKTKWDSEQDNISRLAENRKYGFRVFRSDNNRVSWKELTVSTDGQSTVVHSVPGPGGKRIAYFTDYSVVQLNQDSMGAQKARVYWYKVVPSFNGSDLVFYDNDAELKFHNDLALVKVTLPPPNMALVHRWMANRSQCLEIGKSPRMRENYSCDFRGLGSVPKRPPFVQNDTKLDLRGDLLIDRYELGCRFSRGPESLQSTLGSADYSTSSSVVSLSQNSGCFKVGGSPTVTGATNPLPGLDLGNGASVPSGDLPNYLLMGDCIGESQDKSIPWSNCNSDIANRGGVSKVSVSSIGFSVNPDPANTVNNHLPNLCQTHYVDKRFGIKHSSDATGYLNKDGNPDSNSPFEWVKHNLAQSQFGAVYHNTNTSSSFYTTPVVGINNSNQLVSLGGKNSYSASCSINLAAIDPADNQLIPRWVNLIDLDGSIENLKTSSTVGDVLSNNKLYKNGHLNAPTTSLSPSTKLGRVMTTNRADAPPITGINREIAEQLCNNYEVNVMVSGQSDNEILLSTHSKRLIRRREFLAANMWPENYNKTHTNYLEGVDYSSTTISSKWTGLNQYSGSNRCANAPGSDATLTRWSTLPNRPQGTNPFFTGSDSTKLCMSRYGVQDLVGNIEELGSEILHCAYTSVKMNYGKISDPLNQWSANGGRDVQLEDLAPTAPQVDIGLLSSGYRGGYYLLRKRTPGSSTTESPYFTIKRSDGTINAVFTDDNPSSARPDQFGPYVGEVGDDAGYCSLVDTEPTRRKEAFNQFETLDFFSNSFTKALNSILFKEINPYDPLSVINFRDGKGYFLDFGKTHLANRLLYKDSLGFPWSWDLDSSMPVTPSMGGSQNWNDFNENNYFFSHLLGLPLTCGGFDVGDATGNSWWGACAKDDQNNTLLIEEETAEHSALPAAVTSMTDGIIAGTVINNFHIGGSKITNDGLREVSLVPRSIEAPSVGTTNPPNSMNIITGVQLQSFYDQPYGPVGSQTNAIPQNIIKIEKAVSEDDTQRLQETNKVTTISAQISDTTKFEPGSTIYYWDVSWVLPRNSNMNFYQGGHYDNNNNIDRHNGRFSLHVGTKDYSRNTGIRCGVLINESN